MTQGCIETAQITVRVQPFYIIPWDINTVINSTCPNCRNRSQ